MTSEGNPFKAWLELQLSLQIDAFHEDPRALDDESRAHFLIWNAFSADDEIHEAMKEVGWKPWATSRHMNTDDFLGELVDALHFIGNMILAAATDEGETAEELAEFVWDAYQHKIQENIRRQREGYSGKKDRFQGPEDH